MCGVCVVCAGRGAGRAGGEDDPHNGMGGALDPNSTCEGADTLFLSMGEGVPRPIRILCELCDPNDGGAAVASAEVALPLSSTGETKGTLEALPLGGAGAEPDDLPYACLTIAYGARENDHEVDEASRVEPTSEEALAGLPPRPLWPDYLQRAEERREAEAIAARVCSTSLSNYAPWKASV